MYPYLFRFVREISKFHCVNKRLSIYSSVVFFIIGNVALAGQNSLEIRLGYAQFIDKAVQELYGYGAPDTELEANFTILPLLSLWGNLSCVWQSGRSLGEENHTELSMKTASAGFKIIFFCPPAFFQLYLGLGVLGTYFYEQSHIPPYREEFQRWGSGAVGKLGLHVCFKNCIFFDPFLDYYYQPLTSASDALITASDAVNVGGLRVGMGVGYVF